MLHLFATLTACNVPEKPADTGAPADTDTAADADTASGTDTADDSGDTGASAATRVSPSEATAVIVGTYGNAWLGRLLVAGDFDGDGGDDLAMLAQGSGGSPYNGGTVHVANGAIAGRFHADALPLRLDGEVELGQAMDLDAADVDADGQADLLVSVFDTDSREVRPSAVYVVRGPLGATGSLQGDLALSSADPDRAVGWATSIGDLDADAVPDVVTLGAYDSTRAGNAHVAMFPGPIAASADVDAAAASVTGFAIAYTVDAGADLDGDGVGDLVVGETGWEDWTGRAHVFAGPVTGALDVADADATLVGPAASTYAASDLAAADLDGDGHDDLVVGAVQGSTSNPGGGSAWIVPGPVPSGDLETVARGIVRSDTAFDYTGERVRPVGDVDGDGIVELMVSVRGKDLARGQAGAACVIPTVPVGVVHPLDAGSLCFVGDDERDFLGDDFVTLDLDGDGLLDFAVGDSEAAGETPNYAGEVLYFAGSDLRGH